MVVVGHTWRGMDSAGLLDKAPKGLFAAIDDRIYAFHMPLFFLLSGLFVVTTVRRLSASKFIANRVLRLFYPLVLWTYIFAAVKVLAGDLANDPIRLNELLISPIPGKWQFWFLWALLMLQIGILIVRPALTKKRWRRGAIYGILLVSITLQVLPISHAVHFWTSNALTYFPYLAIGMMLTEFGTNLLLAERKGPLYLFIFVIVLAAVPLLRQIPNSHLLTAVVLCLCSIGISIWWTDRQINQASKLAFIGRYSMIIFLSHTIFSAGARETMIAFITENILLNMITATFVGIAFPIGLQRLTAQIMNPRMIGA